MSTWASLSEFADFLRAQQLLLTVSREVDPNFELHAVVRKIQAGPNLPVLFERVHGTRFPVISNTLGNYAIIARLLGADVTRVAARWAELTASATEPVTLEHPSSSADFQEVSLSDLPQIVYCEKDAGPYLTASVIVAQDPDTEVVNLSYHRMQIVSAAELRCRLSTSGDLFRIHQKQERRGRPLSAVVVLGLPPAMMLAAGATIGGDRSEYDLAARISGRRFPIRSSPTLGLPVPAASEILIEGRILPDLRRPEGPFGEWMDYYVPVTDNHVFEVDHVFARRGAMFYAISSGSTEEIAITSLPIAGGVYANVRTWVPSVRDVSCFPLLQFCAISIDKQFEGQPQRAILAAFGAEMNRVLYCVVVDGDVDIHDWRDVLWAMATRCRPDRDIIRIPNVPSFARDPHQEHWGRLGVDATKPLAHAAEFERKTIPGLSEIRLEDYVR